MKKIIFSLIGMMLLGSPSVYAQPETDLGVIVVTASRIEQAGEKITANVTVIDRKQIEASNAHNIPDMLEKVLGVHVYDLNSAKTAKMDVRGFGDASMSNVLFLVNDRKTNSIDMSGADLLQIPLEAVERIEVIRGAGSVLYGDNAVGGVVNIITKKGQGDLTGKTSGYYGSYDRRGSDVEVSGSQKKLTYYLFSKYDDARGYRQNSDTLAKDYQTRVGYKVSDRLSLETETGWHDDRYGQPGSLTDAQLATLGRRGSTNDQDSAWTRDRFVNLSFNVTPWPENIYLGRFVIDTNYRNRDAYTNNVGWSSDTKYMIDTTGVTGKYIFDKEIFGKKVSFVTGIDSYDNVNDIIRESFGTTKLTISKKELGGYGFLEYELFDKFYVNGGTRNHRARYVFDQKNGSEDIVKKPEEWVSMGGVKYAYAENSNVFLNVQQTFRFLATDEWFNTITGVLNTDLRQQTGIQYEAGVKHQLNDQVNVNLTSYLIDINDEIYYNPTGGNFGWGANENYDKTRRTGFEAGTNVYLLKIFPDVLPLNKLDLYTNYTYENPRFQKGPYDGKVIPMVPRHQLSVGLVAGFAKYYQLSLTDYFVGSQFVGSDTSNSLTPLKPYSLLDAKLSFRKDNLEIFGEVNNMLNTKYYSYVTSWTTTKYYYPAPERNFNVGLSMKF